MYITTVCQYNVNFSLNESNWTNFKISGGKNINNWINMKIKPFWKKKIEGKEL